MIESFRVWLIGLLSVSLILTVLSTLLPEGSVKKIAGVTGGLVLLLVVLRGIVRLDLSNIRLSYDSCAREISRQMERYREKNRSQLEELIAHRTAAYIYRNRHSPWVCPAHPRCKRRGRRRIFPSPPASSWTFPIMQSWERS